LFYALLATLVLHVPGIFFNLPFWNDADKKCYFTVAFFFSQSVFYWVWLREERKKHQGIK
jgi:hypothetical protein